MVGHDLVRLLDLYGCDRADLECRKQELFAECVAAGHRYDLEVIRVRERTTMLDTRILVATD